jgi:NAD(P)-dependent dehydrogenase (short-subunit alcohol dehydrogenase family)
LLVQGDTAIAVDLHIITLERTIIMDVAGKKAVIFGGTSGIGLAAAKQLAALGCEVIAVSRNPDKAGDLPSGISLKACDVLDRDAMTALFTECAPFDILISAATGGDRAIGPFLSMDMDGYRGSFDKLWLCQRGPFRGRTSERDGFHRPGQRFAGPQMQTRPNLAFLRWRLGGGTGPRRRTGNRAKAY